MRSSRRPPAAMAVDSSRRTVARRSPLSGRRLAVPLGVAGALFAFCLLIGNATATPGCEGGQTTDASGSVVYGSPCSDEIVVTSPEVETVIAGDGDDVIYANGEVEEVYGGEGSDVIYGEPPGIEESGGAGVVYEPEPEALSNGPLFSRTRKAGALATTSNDMECPTSPCFGGDGSQEMFGGPGNDTMFGQRGNDTLRGEAGSDALFGGIGDDTILAGDGLDRLSGGLGTDTLDGNEGTDHLRGDGTVDVLRDTGSEGVDTLSFSTAVAPGFLGPVPVAGYPPEGNGEERGVYLRLDGAAAPCGTQSCNNDARYGGGGDEISVAGFERVIGSPFADYIVGSEGNNAIFGGGGNDVLIGNGGNDVLYGGGEGDLLNGGAGTDTVFDSGENSCVEAEQLNGCTGSGAEVQPRDRSKITVGRMTTTQLLGSYPWESFYLVGSASADIVTASVVEGQRSYLVFTAAAGSASFDTSPNAAAAATGCEPAPSEVKCRIDPSIPADSLTLAGMAGDDRLVIAGKATTVGITTSPVLLGGQGSDVLFGSGETEDTLVDGDGFGNDELRGFGFDDALLNNEGSDRLLGGEGSDLLVSIATCGGDILQGSEGKKGDGDAVNNASWAQLPESSGGVVADLARGKAGSQLVAEPPITSRLLAKKEKEKAKAKEVEKKARPACPSGAVDRLRNIDDLEGSSQGDWLFGDANSNNLLGRNGEDALRARGGDDRVAAQDGERDAVAGGAGTDICAFDEGLDTVKGCSP